MSQILNLDIDYNLSTGELNDLVRKHHVVVSFLGNSLGGGNPEIQVSGTKANVKAFTRALYGDEDMVREAYGFNGAVYSSKSRGRSKTRGRSKSRGRH